MSRKIEQPVVKIEEDGPLAGERSSHPAFAQIGAFRTTGQTHLYGSDFQHHNYIHIEIKPSEMLRSHHQEWFFDKGCPIIDVALSEAQWATFVSSMNVGSGVPCTIQARDGESIPGLPAPGDCKQKHSNEVSAAVKKAADILEDLDHKLITSGLSRRKADELSALVRKAHMAITDSAPFIVGKFDEHMEKTVEKAKIEVNAYATHHLMSLGRAALEAQPPILSLQIQPCP